MKIPEHHSVHKGLQAPLIFRQLKGTFIYYGLGCLLSGLLLTMLLSALISLWAGLMAGVLISGVGLGITLHVQRKGLYQKSRFQGIVHLTKLI